MLSANVAQVHMLTTALFPTIGGSDDMHRSHEATTAVEGQCRRAEIEMGISVEMVLVAWQEEASVEEYDEDGGDDDEVDSVMDAELCEEFAVEDVLLEQADAVETFLMTARSWLQWVR